MVQGEGERQGGREAGAVVHLGGRWKNRGLGKWPSETWENGQAKLRFPAWHLTGE